MSTTTTASAHGVLVGIVILVVFAVILVEVAGSSPELAKGIGVLLLALLLIDGMSHSTALLNWSKSNPFNPN